MSCLRNPRSVLGWVSLFVLALAVNWAGNWDVSLWDRDGPRFAQATREMRERLDPIVPTFNDRMRPDKPPQAYWAMWIATMLTGDDPFGARMAQGFAGAVTVLILSLFARRVARRDFRLPDPEARRLGFLAGLLFLVSPLVVVESKIATADAFLIRFLTLAHVGLYEAVRPSEADQRSRPWWLLFWVSCGLAVLAKGFVGWILPLGTVGLLALWIRFFPPAKVSMERASPRWGHLHFGRGALISALCVLPWAVAVFVRTDGEFIRKAIWVHQVERALHPFEGHSGSMLFYPLSLLIGFFPGVALLALWLGRQRRGEAEVQEDEAGSRALATRFLISWAVFPILFFTPLATKLPHYILPAYPALSLLGAWGFFAARSTGGRWVSLALLALLTLVTTGVGVAASSFATEIIPKGAWDTLMESIRPTLILSGVLLVAASGLMAIGVLDRRIRWPMTAALLLAVLWIVVGIRLLPSLEPVRAFPNLGRDAREAGIEKVLCAWTPEPSLVYHGGVRVEKLDSPQRVIDRLVEMDSEETSPKAAALFTESEWASLGGVGGVAALATQQGLNVANGKWGTWVLVVPDREDIEGNDSARE